MSPCFCEKHIELAIYDCQQVSFTAELVDFLTRHAKCVVCSAPIRISLGREGFDYCDCGKNAEDKSDAFFHLRYDNCSASDFVIKVRFDSAYGDEFEKLWEVVHRRIASRRKTQKRFKALGSSGKILPKRQARLLLEAQEFKCYYCKTDVSERYDLDHKRPIADGGTNDVENVVVACPNCNRKKRDKPKDEFIKVLQKGMSQKRRIECELWRHYLDNKLDEVTASWITKR